MFLSVCAQNQNLVRIEPPNRTVLTIARSLRFSRVYLPTQYTSSLVPERRKSRWKAKNVISITVVYLSAVEVYAAKLVKRPFSQFLSFVKIIKKNSNRTKKLILISIIFKQPLRFLLPHKNWLHIRLAVSIFKINIVSIRIRKSNKFDRLVMLACTFATIAVINVFDAM